METDNKESPPAAAQTRSSEPSAPVPEPTPAGGFLEIEVLHDLGGEG